MTRFAITGFTPRVKFIIVSSLTLIPLAGVLLVVFLLAFAPVFTAMETVVRTTLNELLPAQRLQTALHRAAMPPNDYLIHGSPDERQLFDGLSMELERAFDALAAAVPEGDPRRPDLDAAREHWNQARALARDLLALTDPVGDPAAAEQMEQYDAVIEDAARELERLNEATRLRIHEAFKRTQALESKGLWMTLGAAVFALLIGFLGAAALTRERHHMQETSVRDPLTGLYNRRGFESWLKENAQATLSLKRPNFSLMMIDADKFKQVNDTYGHQAGDDVLKGVAEVIRGHLRDGDLFARLGGDEFVIVVPDIGDPQVMAMADRLRQAVEGAPMAHADDGTPLRVTLTIGCASFPRDAESVDSLIASADAALYAAKEQGRNCVVCYTPDLEPDAAGSPA